MGESRDIALVSKVLRLSASNKLAIFTSSCVRNEIFMLCSRVNGAWLFHHNKNYEKSIVLI